MKNMITILSLVMVFASQAMAESHGGVRVSNAQMKAVSKYALDGGGDLYRVLKIQKKNDGLFTISYGGMDSNGNEKVSDEEVVKAAVTYDGSIDVKVKVEHVRGIDFSK
jgi:hypothetical protein